VQGADDSYSEVEDSVLRLLVLSWSGAIKMASRYSCTADRISDHAQCSVLIVKYR
jgi:hypothetical protein